MLVNRFKVARKVCNAAEQFASEHLLRAEMSWATYNAVSPNKRMSEAGNGSRSWLLHILRKFFGAENSTSHARYAVSHTSLIAPEVKMRRTPGGSNRAKKKPQ
jgi:hypothetical protein